MLFYLRRNGTPTLFKGYLRNRNIDASITRNLFEKKSFFVIVLGGN